MALRIRHATDADWLRLVRLFNRVRESPFICQPPTRTRPATVREMARFAGPDYRVRLVEDVGPIGTTKLLGFMVGRRRGGDPPIAQILYWVMDYDAPFDLVREAARLLAHISALEARADGISGDVWGDVSADRPQALDFLTDLGAVERKVYGEDPVTREPAGYRLEIDVEGSERRTR